MEIMKSCLLNLTIFLILPLLSKGQEPINYGLSISQGIAYAKIKSEEHSTNTNELYTYQIGGYLNRRISKSDNFWKLSLHYARRGYKFRIHNFLDEGKIKASLKLHYMTVSPTFHYSSKIEESFGFDNTRVFFYAGPYFSVKIGQRWKYNKQVVQLKDGLFNAIDWGVNVGVGFWLRNIKDHELYVSIYNTIGLQNILKRNFNSFHQTRLRAIGISFDIPIDIITK